MIPLSQILSITRTRYEAVSGGSSTRFSDAQLIQFTNECVQTLAEEALYYERYVTVPLAQDTCYYDIRGFTPETPVAVRAIFSSARQQWLTPTTTRKLEQENVSWETGRGDPISYFTPGPFWFGVFPIPEASTGLVRVTFAGIPSKATHPQAILSDIPDKYATSLTDYLMYEMAGMDRQPQRAILHWSEYSKAEAELKNFIDRRLARVTGHRLGRFAGTGA